MHSSSAWITFGYLTLAILGSIPASASADGLADNQDAQVRPIPPLGLELEPAVRAELLQAVEAIDREIPKPSSMSSVDKQRSGQPEKVDWWNDVRVISRAVRLTIEGQQFAKEAEIDQARKLLALAGERILELKSAASSQKGFEPSWAQRSGRIIAGHRSRLDDSIQPFGILVPETAANDSQRPRRLDIWLHGRDENVSEVAFLYRRWTQDSPYLPEDTFVLQPWGRYSNAFRFAGEVDVFEALAEVQRRYAIDPNRISIRGFSMGGAGCWNLAVHHPDRFFAANPGAGFCETERFLTGFQSETLTPTPAQRRLWSLYDCPPVVRNLTNLPTIAYSGGLDRQKEAADIMTAAATQSGLTIPYVIHPESAHAIHPDAKIQIEQQMTELAKKGRPTFPQSVVWSTFSLRQPGAYWVHLTGLQEHWTKATIEARFSDDCDKLTINTDNVRSFEIKVPAGQLGQKSQNNQRQAVSVFIDGLSMGAIHVEGNGALEAGFEFADRVWKAAASQTSRNLPTPSVLQKRPGLQGPIDDAFLDRFLIVRPTGTSKTPAIDQWVERELQHAIDHWRLQFRGQARVKTDLDVTAADLQDSNLICFGTPESNLIIAKIAKDLPIRWTDKELSMGSQRFETTEMVPLLIYPNPLAQHRYVVLNSGFTYREYDYLNNARQTPKLPDWAIIDATSPQTTRAAGRVIAEGFFNEQWR